MTCGIDYGDASYKGIPFEIRPSSSQHSQRLLTHLYPFTDRHYNERLGDKPQKFSISGAFIGEDFRDQMTVAKRIWLDQESGEFYEPTENRTFNVDLVTLDFNLDSKRLNYVAFDMELVESSDDPYPEFVDGNAGQIDGILADYFQAVEDAHTLIEETAGIANDVIFGVQVAGSYVENSFRQFIRLSFPELRQLINNFTPSRIGSSNRSHFNEVFDGVADTVSSAPTLAASSDSDPQVIGFFKQVSELRSIGTPAQVAQTEFVSRQALGYYFEQIVNGSNFFELQQFITRATALKRGTTSIPLINAIDRLILEVGASTAQRDFKTLEGTRHALVASYEIYGNVSQATDILARSGGVSGAFLQGAVYPCE